MTVQAPTFFIILIILIIFVFILISLHGCTHSIGCLCKAPHGPSNPLHRPTLSCAQAFERKRSLRCVPCNNLLRGSLASRQDKRHHNLCCKWRAWRNCSLELEKLSEATHTQRWSMETDLFFIVLIIF